MKKLLLISILLMTDLINSACAPEGEDEMIDDTHSENESSAASEFIQSNLTRETDPQVSMDEIIPLGNDNNDFGFAFYEQIMQDEGNIIFSPLSLSLALSMALAGAETSTEQGMLQALQFSFPEEDVHSVINALLLYLEFSEEYRFGDSEGSNFQLNIANSTWGQSGFEFKQAFLDTLAQNYGAGIHKVDFISEPEFARIAINEWVEEETEEKITDLIPVGAITPLTRMVLANAIYFYGSWFHPFSESGTSAAPFTLLDGSEISVEMMKLSGKDLNFFQDDHIQAVDLPYLNTDFAMTILLPDAGAFPEVETELDRYQYSTILDDMQSESVNLHMPKFDFISDIDAKAPLIALGMEEAFDMDQADFSGITDEDELYISDVLHQAAISVDESGTEAAAATAVIIAVKGMPVEPISMVVDRPFLFFIRHVPTGSILFMGRVTNPNS